MPAKAPKKAKPTRHGWVWIASDDAGQVLVVRRPAKGLLGGMLALPTGVWAEMRPAPEPPFAADWREVGEVRHTFTHFHLCLTVMVAEVERIPGEARARADAADAMPTVFAKALRLAGPG